MPKISVVIPVYNSSKTIRRCLNSVISQTFKDIEIILINDGSTDGSGKICDSFAQNDKRIQVYHIENGGVSNARNLGIKKASGKYIQFVDSDDWVELNMLEVLFKKAETENSDVVVCTVVFHYPTGRNFIPDLTDRVYTELNMFKDLPHALVATYLFNPPWNKLYKLGIIQGNSLIFNLDLSIGEDLLFNVEYFSYAKNIVCISLPLYNYDVQLEGSLSWGKIHYNEIEAYKINYTALYEMFFKMGINDVKSFNLIQFRFVDLLRRFITKLYYKKEKIEAKILLAKILDDIQIYSIIKKNKFKNIHCALFFLRNCFLIYLFYLFFEKPYRRLKRYDI